MNFSVSYGVHYSVAVNKSWPDDIMAIEREIALHDFYMRSVEDFGEPAKLQRWEEWTDNNSRKGLIEGEVSAPAVVATEPKYKRAVNSTDVRSFLDSERQILDPVLRAVAARKREFALLAQKTKRFFRNPITGA